LLYLTQASEAGHGECASQFIVSSCCVRKDMLCMHVELTSVLSRVVWCHLFSTCLSRLASCIAVVGVPFSVSATTQLAQLYLLGYGLSQRDPSRAMSLYTRAATHGDRTAQYILGAWQIRTATAKQEEQVKQGIESVKSRTCVDVHENRGVRYHVRFASLHHL
jgi:hypothetical protein